MRQHLTLRADPELAALAAAGDRAAFGELARRHGGAVRTLLRRMGAQPALADDLAQDALVAAFEAVGAWRNDGPFQAWVGRIAARLYIRRWRREARIELRAEPEDAPRFADGEVAANARLDLDEALKTLTPAERLCVSLCHGAGFSHGEAAEVLQAPLGTVKSHVKRGLDKLKVRLDPLEARSTAHG